MLRAARVTADEIARAAGVAARSIQRRAAAEQWPHQAEAARGATRHLYDVASLPADLREALMRSLAQSAPVVPTTALPGPIGATGDRERRTLEARAALLQHLDGLAEVGGVSRAVAAMIDLARRGALPAPLQALVPLANARSGRAGGRTLSRASLFRWLADRAKGGTEALMPRPPQRREPPAWAAALLKLHANPQKRPLAWAVDALARELAGTGIAAPSYDQARRFLASMSTVDRERGRMGPRALKTIRPFVRRDVSELMPLDVIQMDGHQYDAEWAHPVTGKPFRPEITASKDARTRVWLAWSAGQAESAQAVMDCFAATVRGYGVPTILYADNGSGYTAAVNSDPVLGLFARAGTRLEHSLPYNSQARGQIERLNQALTADAAELPTYLGAPMDAEARQRVFKLTRADAEAARRRLALISWADGLARIEAARRAYNDRPHRGLPRLRDPATGTWRHQTPNEALQGFIDQGWEPVRLSAAALADLYRPHREATVIRGEVRLFGQTYFARALEDWHGQAVQVAYDVRDAAKVWVKTRDGRFIAEAGFEANTRAMFPVARLDQARADRAAAQQRRLRRQADEAEAQSHGGALDAEPLDADVIELADHMLAEIAARAAPAALPAPLAPGERPALFADDGDLVAWLKAHPDQITDADRAWVREQLRSAEWRALHEIHDVTDLTTGGTVAG